MLTHGRYLIGPPPNHGSRTAATDSGVNQGLGIVR